MADSKSGRLTQEQFFRLCRQVEAHADRYKTERPHFTIVARELAKALDVPINDTQVRRAAETVGCLWEPAKAARSQEHARTRDQVKELAERVGGISALLKGATAEGTAYKQRVDGEFVVLRSELAILRGVVVKVAEELGMAIPPGMVPPNGKLPFAVAGK